MHRDSATGRGSRQSSHSSACPRGTADGADSPDRFLLLAAVFLLPVAVSGCGLFGPSTADLTVTVSTTGEPAEIDSDGYGVTVSGAGAEKRVNPSGSTIFEEVETGQREVRLAGLQDNCSVDGGNPKTVKLESDGATVNFSVSCGPIPPELSNGESEVTGVNDCSFEEGANGSSILTSFDYSDDAGDVTSQDATVEVQTSFGDEFTFSLTDDFVSRTGDGSSGTITIDWCVRFGDAESWETTNTLVDALGRSSNSVTITVDRPEGANSVAPSEMRPVGEPGWPASLSGGL